MKENSKHNPVPIGKPLKVVIYGPESTGKTTLAKELAVHYDTKWVPEFMRGYLEKKWELKGEMISQEDLIPIAKGQLESEILGMESVDDLLICDTDLLELKVYSEYYYDGYCPKEIKEEATKNVPSIYLLTYIDTIWEPDMLRDRPNNREEMFALFEKELKKQGFPYEILKGNKEERIKKAVGIIDALLEE